ncbi:MAG: hypothetical protein [aquatic viral metagenome]
MQIIGLESIPCGWSQSTNVNVSYNGNTYSGMLIIDNNAKAATLIIIDKSVSTVFSSGSVTVSPVSGSEPTFTVNINQQAQCIISASASGLKISIDINTFTEALGWIQLESTDQSLISTLYNNITSALGNNIVYANESQEDINGTTYYYAAIILTSPTSQVSVSAQGNNGDELYVSSGTA